MGSTDGMTLRAVKLHRQTIQPPIAALATIGNFYLYLCICWHDGRGNSTRVGAAIGAHLAHTVSQATLRRVVAWVLVAVGSFIVGRILLA